MLYPGHLRKRHIYNMITDQDPMESGFFAKAQTHTHLYKRQIYRLYLVRELHTVTQTDKTPTFHIFEEYWLYQVTHLL